MIAVDGKTVRGARTADTVAPHLVAAIDHTAGTVPGQAAAAAKSNEIPAVRHLLAGFAGGLSWSLHFTPHDCRRIFIRDAITSEGARG